MTAYSSHRSHAAWGLAVVCLLLAGCSVLPSFTWPWSRNREKAVAKAESKVDGARDEVLRRAQGETTVAAIALRAAADSRPVALAREATDASASLQAQAMGPLSEADRQRFEKLVADLMSENHEVRVAAEASRAKDQAENVRISEKLAAMESVLAGKEKELRDGYLREKALADKYRGLMWTCYGIAAVAVLAGSAWLYVRLTAGGALRRMVAGIERFKTSNSEAAGGLMEHLSNVMDARDKTLVRKVVAEVKP